MKFDIYTQLSKADLKLAKNIIATSSFETLNNYFVYVMNNLASSKIINPVANAGHITAERPLQPVTTGPFRHIVLALNEHELNKAFLKDLARSLSVNSFWTISKIFDYAVSQLLTNPDSTFEFGFNQHDLLIINGAVSKSVLVQLDHLASDYDQNQTTTQKEVLGQ